jgi:hypothetical protein
MAAAALGNLFQLGADYLDGVSVGEQQQQQQQDGGSIAPALTAELLASVANQLGALGVAEGEERQQRQERQEQEQPAEQKWGEGATCITCGLGTTTPGFDTVEQQRAHFKTDWHRCGATHMQATAAAARPGAADGRRCTHACTHARWPTPPRPHPPGPAQVQRQAAAGQEAPAERAGPPAAHR